MGYVNIYSRGVANHARVNSLFLQNLDIYHVMDIRVQTLCHFNQSYNEAIVVNGSLSQVYVFTNIFLYRWAEGVGDDTGVNERKSTLFEE